MTTESQQEPTNKKPLTLKDNGAVLPIGEDQGGKLVKQFDLRPYKTRTDRALGIWREANENKTIAYLVAKYLSLIVSRIGDEVLELDESGDSTPTQEFRFHNWHLVDVFYAYVYSRVMHLGSKVVVPYVCPVPTCKHKDEGTFDLSEAEVIVANNMKSLVRWIDLRRGFVLRDGKRATSVKVKPVSWQTMLGVGAGQSPIGSLTYTSLQSAICGVNKSEKHYTLTEAEVDQIEKIDLITIDRANGEVSAGLSMTTEVRCKKCDYLITGALNWSFDDFFGESFPLD